MTISLEIFKEHFSSLCGAYDRAVKTNTQDAWYAEMSEWDYKLFVDVMHRLKYADGFPKLKDAFDVKRMIAGDPNPRKAEEGLKGCFRCDKGLIYYHKVDADGVICSQGFVGRCAFCNYPQLARYRDIDPVRLKEAEGWDFDWVHYERWRMQKEGKDPDEQVGVSVAKVHALAPFGKADPANEKARERELWREQKREEVEV